MERLSKEQIDIYKQNEWLYDYKTSKQIDREMDKIIKKIKRDIFFTSIKNKFYNFFKSIRGKTYDS